ncbi:MAG TPA: hypothetical protein VGC76_13960 [Pyrinomonadaceae bacterium]|jgi:hypothetical protein
MQEQELFQGYELKGWQWTSHLYKIMGASLIINIVAFFLFAQADFLTGKTCDSALAGGVCSVLDALYLGSEVANSRYVNEDYAKTELEDADITFVEYTEPFKYPEGYFATANPEQTTAQVLGDPTLIPPSTDIPGITNNPTITGGTSDLTNTKPITPTPNNNAVVGSLPKSAFGGGNPTITPRKYKNTRPNKPMVNDSPTTLPGDTTADNKANKTDDAATQNETAQEVKINKQVMVDFANGVKTKIDKQQVDLNQPFKVVAEGVLTKEGKFDTSIDKATKKPKSGITYTEGDKQIVEVATQALEAVGDSGWLGYLRNLGAEKVKITFVQDQEKIFAVVESEQKSPEKAESIASGLGLLISTTKKFGNLGQDETILLNGAQQPTTNGKVFILNFALPKKDVQEMIQRNLKKAAEANQNSTAQTENAEQKTAK